MIEEQIKNLSSHEHYLGRDSFAQLMELSNENQEVVCYINKLLPLLQETNSYFRIRGVLLISENTKWLDESTVNHLLPTILNMLTDEKPIVVRKVLEGLYSIMCNCPYTTKTIMSFLDEYNYSTYSEAMRPIIKKDIMKIKNKAGV